MSPDSTTLQRFWSKVDRTTTPDGCWLWTAGLFGDKMGYGCFKYQGRSRHAHRFAYELTYGPIPAGLCVLHRCDVPTCINPAHLFLGTQLDNIADKVAKGRQAKGERSRMKTPLLGESHPNSKLTEEQVRAIRVRWAAGETFTALGRELGVSKVLVRQVAKRRLWKHVD